MTQHAWQAQRNADGKKSCELVSLPMPTGEVLISISHSALNYKDALAVTGKGAIIRNFPCIPGIDFAGTVAASQNSSWQVGDAVFATGRGLGEERDGGLASHAACGADDLLAIPANWTAADVMGLGTAGLTAMQGIRHLRAMEVTPDKGPIVVTGASGGVATIAISLLHKLTYEVHAVTGKADDAAQCQRLQDLGAAAVIDRNSFTAQAGKALEGQRWAGGIDTTGGEPLAAALRQCLSYGAIATCGVAAGADLPVGMFPFILRGVSLLGISSVYYPQEPRRQAWNEIFTLLDPSEVQKWSTTIPFTEVPTYSEHMLQAAHSGRHIVAM